MYSLYQIFLYLSATISLILAVIVFIKNQKSNISTIFLCLCLSVSLWLVSYAQITDVHNTLIWAKIGFVGITFIPFFIFLFLFSFIKVKLNKILFYCLIFINLIFVLLSFFSKYIFVDVMYTSWGVYPQCGQLYFVFLIYCVSLIVIPIFYLYKYIHVPELTSIKKQKVIHLLLIYSISLILFIFDNLFFYDLFNLEPVFYLTSLFCLILTTFVILSYNLSNIRVLFVKIFIFISMLLFVLFITKYILTFSVNIYVTNFITFMLTVACLFMYRKIVEKTEFLLFSHNRHYQNLLIQAASGMAKEHDLDRLLKLVAIIVLKIVKVNYIAIFLENKKNRVYEVKIIRSFHHRINELMFSYDYNHPFINYILSKNDPFLFEEIPEYISNSLILPFRPSLVIPSFSNDVKGFMVLGDKLNNDVFTKQDIDVFKMLSRQTNLAMQNCLFFDEYKRTQEKIFTAEKLASIGGLAEGVAHQIRNRLNHFAMIAGELKYGLLDFKNKNINDINANTNLLELFEYCQQLSSSLSSNVKQTDDVVKGILDYAKLESKQIMFESLKVQEIVDLSFDLLKIKHHISDNFKLTMLYPQDITIYAIKSQMTEVIYNLIDNAYEAISEKLSVLSKQKDNNIIVPKITISIESNDKYDIIKVLDNGIGIKEDDTQKIFVPFFTTKVTGKSGTGIGLYIVKRIITETHKGKIDIQSTYMQGTQITIELPKNSLENK